MDILLDRVASVLGIIAFLITGLQVINHKIAADDNQRPPTNPRRPPTRLNFYILFFWSVVAAFSGGLVWAALNWLQILGQSPYMGGTASEPHGIAPAIWVLATNLPAIIILLILGRIYGFAQTRPQLIPYGAFLVGTIVSSIVFYDLPLDKNGLRNLLDPQNGTSLSKEFWLALIWSSLPILGFLFMEFTKSRIARTRDFRTLLQRTELLVKQIGLCTGLTTLSITCFLLFVPTLERFDTARGVIAGVVLRTTLFFGLFLGTNPVPPNPFVIFGIIWPRDPQNPSAARQVPANPPVPGSPPQAGP